MLFGFTNDVVAENDPDLAIGGNTFDRLESGLLRRLSVDPLDVVLKLAHQEEDAHYGKGPDDQHAQEETLVCGHAQKSRV